MNTSLLICDYSYHDTTFISSYKSGLTNYLFRLQTEGSSTASFQGHTYQLHSGDLLLLKPGDDYHLSVEDNETEHGGRLSSGDYYLFCEGPWIDQWWYSKKRSSVNAIGIDDKLIGLWRNLLLEKRRGPLGEDLELMDYMLKSLCLYMDRAIIENTHNNRKVFASLRLKRFVEEHATVTFKLEEAADYAGLSLSRAVRLFKDNYGKTMIQYAIEIRLNAAVERMKYSSLTLENIAETCGFSSYSYFHRVFRAKFGMTPLHYRAKHQTKN
ncbi:AraC family transcriptional regulator of arabinose operon [Paenibacillus shirakamiensis]|uniref:AraC family transcriptional regulator of arabinose operon n=1 Tax=Paenibacillus shirakamiensis TaxID=1265935 RepID=A0ABS4JEZ6_9BACL|nr:AraC family transcriptional regulator of arabinose operon [Paenibacillus shirakamiensis]